MTNEQDRSEPSPERKTELISESATAEEQYLRQIFVRDQMAEWSKDPFLLSRAEGVHYYDIDGKRYLDGISGIYVASVGHGNQRVIDAVREQLDVLSFSPPMHGTNPIAVQLANLLADLAPGELSAVKFQCGGSEVTEAAIKLARQYHKLRGKPGKFKIISRYLSWHGSTMGSLSASGLKGRKTVNEPLAPGFVHVFPPTCYRCPFGKEYPGCEMTCASIIEDVIEMEDPDTVAAILVEPIGHTGGIIDPPEEYLPMLREICDRHDALLMFDEIITGVGRTGELFAAQTFGVEPDVICVGKGLGGGYAPLSAMICSRSIADDFWGPIESNPGFVEGHTFEGNPISCAAGLAVLREILERDLLANARERGEQLRRGLEELSARHAAIGDIRGKGLFQGIELVQNRTTKERFAVDSNAGGGFGVRVGRHALEKGLLCRFDPHWIALGPPLVTTSEDIEEILRILDESLSEVT